MRRIIALCLPLTLIFQNSAFALRTENSQSAKVKSGLEEALQLVPVPTIAGRNLPLAAAGAEEGLKFGDPKVWGDEEKRTQQIVEGVLAFLADRRDRYGETQPDLFSVDRVAERIAHLQQMWQGIQADMVEQPGPVSVGNLKSVQEQAQLDRFGKILWGTEVTGSTWRGIPYNVAQALLFSEMAWTTGFFDQPENPLTDFYKAFRDKQQEDALITQEGNPTLPSYVKFVLRGQEFEKLQYLSVVEKRAILRRAILLTVKGNALDPNVLDKLKVSADEIAAELGDEGAVIVNDVEPVVRELTESKIREMVLLPDNVGVEMLGATILTAVYLRMYPARKVTWLVKDAAYLKSDIVRRDLTAWSKQVQGVDGRSWFDRFQDEKYNPWKDAQTKTLRPSSQASIATPHDLKFSYIPGLKAVFWAPLSLRIWQRALVGPK